MSDLKQNPSTKTNKGIDENDSAPEDPNYDPPRERTTKPASHINGTSTLPSKITQSGTAISAVLSGAPPGPRRSRNFSRKVKTLKDIRSPYTKQRIPKVLSTTSSTKKEGNLLTRV